MFGVPCDFRLDYGRQINHRAKVVSINQNRKDMLLNIKPSLCINHNPAIIITNIAKGKIKNNWTSWINSINKKEKERNKNIQSQADEKTGKTSSRPNTTINNVTVIAENQTRCRC